MPTFSETDEEVEMYTNIGYIRRKQRCLFGVVLPMSYLPKGNDVFQIKKLSLEIQKDHSGWKMGVKEQQSEGGKEKIEREKERDILSKLIE